jgi:hypothetical protein
MRCPQCGEEIEDDKAICGHCDYIIDKSFLGDDFTDIEPERPSARRSAQDTSVDSSATPRSENLSVEASRVTDDVQNTLKKIWGNFQKLSFPDKLAVGGSAGMFLFAFFPWVSVSGVVTITGFEVGGWFTTVLAAATIAIVFMRQNGYWRDGEKYVLYVQTGIAVIAVLFTLSRMFFLGKSVPFPGIATADIGAGLFLCFLSSVTILGGAFLLLKEKVLKK